MHTIEHQLRHHVRTERHRRQRQEDLLHADPWEGSLGLHGNALDESTHSYSSGDEFFSLDLGGGGGGGKGGLDQSVNMEDSFVSTLSQVSSAPANAHIHGRCFPQDGVNGIPLHAGAGLQQLSESPPEGVFKKVPTSPSYSPPAGHRPRPRSGTGTSGGASSSVRSHRHSDSQHDAFKLSLTLSGVTLALLESEPAYTCSITPQPSVERRDSDSSSGSDGGRGMEVMSGLEEGGLDPMKYLEGVASLLSGEVSRRAIQGCQEQLSRGLPNDHLLWVNCRPSLSLNSLYYYFSCS